MSNTYFYQLDFNIITSEERACLQEFVMAHSSTFIDNVSRQGNKDGNQLFPDLTDINNELLQSIRSRVTIPCKLGMVRHLPGVVVTKHTDGSPFRRTVLSVPLLPEPEYPPTYFWDTIDSLIPCCQATYQNMNPCLLNTRKIHNVINNDKMRANLQLCFTEDIIEVEQMIINNTLFKKL
jgi:hypothetical protein